MYLYNWVNSFLLFIFQYCDSFLYQPFQKNLWGGARSCSRLIKILCSIRVVCDQMLLRLSLIYRGRQCRTLTTTSLSSTLPCSTPLSPRWRFSPGLTLPGSHSGFGEWSLCFQPLYPSCYCKQGIMGYTLLGMLPTLENCWPCPRVTVTVCIPGIFQTLWNLTDLGSPSSHTLSFTVTLVAKLAFAGFCLFSYFWYLQCDVQEEKEKAPLFFIILRNCTLKK